MIDLLSEISKNVVDNPDQVFVKAIDGANTLFLELSVAKEDLGKINGANGRNIQAIRTIMMAVSGKIKKRIIVELAE